MAAVDAMLDRQIGKRKAQEQKVMDYLLAHKDSIMDLSITEIAQGAGVSSPTVVRFCKSLGYEGLKDFKVNFQSETRKNKQIQDPITWESSDEEIRTLMDAKSVYSVQSLFSDSNMDSISKMAKAIVKARNTDIIGMGGSAIIAEYLSKELIRYGKKVSLFIDPYMTRHNVTDNVDGDIYIAISCSGTNNDVLSAAINAKNEGKELFSITNNADSPLAQISDAFITSCTVTGFKDEGNAFSRLSQFAAVNMLTLMTAIYLGRNSEEYKRSFNESSNYHNFLSGDKNVH